MKENLTLIPSSYASMFNMAVALFAVNIMALNDFSRCLFIVLIVSDDQGYSCIHWAVKRGDYEILQELNSHGANMEVASSYDARMKPVHWAASDGKLLSIKFFFDHRFDINAQDANGCTPVIIASQYNRISTVIYLIKNGADLTLKDVNGDTGTQRNGRSSKLFLI